MDTSNSTAERIPATRLDDEPPPRELKLNGPHPGAQSREELQARPEQAARLIEALLGDGRRERRLSAIALLESLRHANTTAWLTRVLEQDPDVELCIAAINLLGAVGDHRCVAALQAVKQRFHDQPHLVFAADVALGEIE